MVIIFRCSCSDGRLSKTIIIVSVELDYRIYSVSPCDCLLLCTSGRLASQHTSITVTVARNLVFYDRRGILRRAQFCVGITSNRGDDGKTDDP